MNFKEYDVVISRQVLDNVPIGSIGAILLCHGNSNYYEVEFIDSNGNTINVLTVSGNDLDHWAPNNE